MNKILGREPAAIVGAVQAVLVLGVSFGWFAGIGAIVLAIATSETLLAPVIELFKASLALGAIYGLHITTEQTGLAIATITAIITAFQRTQVSPTVVQLRPRDQRGAIALPPFFRRAA